MDKKYKYTVYIILLALFPTPGFTQIYSLMDFAVCNQCPKEIVDGKYPPATIKKHIQVFLRNNNLQIANANLAPGLYIKLTSSGEFVGLNNGEWGGGLYLKPKIGDSISVNGTVRKASLRFEQASSLLNKNITVVPNVTGKAIPIVYGNIYGLTSFKDDLIIARSLESLYEHVGTLLKVSYGNTIKVTDLAKFEGIPLAIGTSNDSIYLATTEGIYIYDDKLHKRLIKIKELGLLSPNSLVVLKNNQIAVGGVSGYYLINLATGQSDFYVLKNLIK